MKPTRRKGTASAWFPCALLLATLGMSLETTAGAETVPQSVLEETVLAGPDGAVRIEVTVLDERGEIIPCCVALRSRGAKDFAGFDPVGRGLNVLGEFYARGRFHGQPEPGEYLFSVRSGYDKVPFEKTVRLEVGKTYRWKVTLRTWFDPASMGWYCAEFHAHGFHGPAKPTGVRMILEGTRYNVDYDYMALVGRAAGLNLLFDNLGHHTKWEERFKEAEARNRTQDFILSISCEMRFDPLGHFNVPGTRPGFYGQAKPRYPFLALEIFRATRQFGGAMVYTNCMRWPSFYHGHTALEVFSHAVLEEGGDLFDIGLAADREIAIIELLGLWNLGFRVGAAATSDEKLNWGGPPGSRRTYVKAGEFSLPAVVAGCRSRRTVAVTGPLFATLAIGEAGPGETVPPGEHLLSFEVHALRGLDRVEVIVDGGKLVEVDGGGAHHLSRDQIRIALADGGYVCIVAHDLKGAFAVPTAIFCGATPTDDKYFTAFYIDEIDRRSKSTGRYFLHLMATVNKGDRITEVTLSKDARVLEEIPASRGDFLGEGTRWPIICKYPKAADEKCWRFWPDRANARHLLLTYPLRGEGAYAAKIRTAGGRIVDAGAIRFSTEEPYTWQMGLVGICCRNGTFSVETRGPFSGPRRGRLSAYVRTLAIGRGGKRLHTRGTLGERGGFRNPYEETSP